jgi:hypothetical protein
MATFAMTCEERLPFFGVSGQCTIFESIPDNPTNIIRTNENWGVIFNWTTNGPLNFLIAGTWHLDVLLEKWGPGEAPALPGTTVAFVSAPNIYNRVMTFAPQAEGSYKITTRLKLHGPGGIPGPLVCMAEGPMLDFYVAAFP